MLKSNLPYLKPIVSIYILALLGYLYVHPWMSYAPTLLLLLFGTSLPLALLGTPVRTLLISLSIVALLILFYFKIIPSPFGAFIDLNLGFGPSFLLTVLFMAGIMSIPWLLMRLVPENEYHLHHVRHET